MWSIVVTRKIRIGIFNFVNLSLQVKLIFPLPTTKWRFWQRGSIQIQMNTFRAQIVLDVVVYSATGESGF